MTDAHHLNPSTYADTLEDCLLGFEGLTPLAETAEYWGGKAGDSMASLCDHTDGPATRVRFVGDDAAIGVDLLRESRLRPDESGTFVVSEHQYGQGLSDCVLMTMEPPLDDGLRAASVEKWVPKEQIDLFPIGRRFTLEPLAK